MATKKPAATATVAVPFVPGTPLVVEPTKWSRRQFDRRSGATALGSAVGSLEQMLTTYREDLANGVKGIMARPEDEGIAHEVSTELFSMLHGRPDATAAPIRWASTALDAARALPEFSQLQQHTRGDADMAALATSTILPAVSAKLKEMMEDARKRGERVNPSDPGEPGNGSSGPDDDGTGPGPGSDTDPGDGATDGTTDGADGAALRATLRRALSAAADAVSKASDKLSAAGIGSEAGDVFGEDDDLTRAKLAELLLNSPDFSDIVDKLGRLRAADAVADVAKVKGGRSGTLVGIEIGGELERLIPSELAKFVLEDTELIAMRSIVERGALQFEVQTREPMDRGPVVVLLDMSGSMQGEGFRLGAAVALAALAKARAERRHATLIGFTTEIEFEFAVPVGASDTVWASVLYGMLSSKPDGGTEPTPALRRTFALLGEQAKADVAIVTDGMFNTTPDLVAQFDGMLGRDGRVYGWTVDGGRFDVQLTSRMADCIDLDMVVRNRDLRGAIRKAA